MKTYIILAAIAFSPFAHAEGLDTIFDVDFRFFMQNPRLPWGKDAFRKRPGYVNIPAAEEKLTLQGIARSQGVATAIINGELVNIGSLVSGRKVVEIGPHYVVLEKDSSLIELTLNPEVPSAPALPRAPASAPAAANGENKL